MVMTMMMVALVMMMMMMAMVMVMMVTEMVIKRNVEPGAKRASGGEDISEEIPTTMSHDDANADYDYAHHMMMPMLMLMLTTTFKYSRSHYKSSENKTQMKPNSSDMDSWMEK